MTYRRIHKELLHFQKEPPEDKSIVSLGPAEDTDMFHWTGVIAGPDDSVYAGGQFHIDIRLPVDYPFKPPRVRFTTKIFHPNIHDCGSISPVDILECNWSPALTIIKVVQRISCVLSDPDPDNPLMVEIAQMYKNDRAQFVVTATEWTKKYASQGVGKRL